MKRIIMVTCSLLLAIFLCAGGLIAARKLHAMYKNLWDALDTIEATAEGARESADKALEQMQFIAQKTDHLHRKAFHSGDTASAQYDYSWMDSVPPYIAHAGGGIDERTYTNSREAVLLNYEFGQRVFEIDFNLSEDGMLIASHTEDDWRSMTGSDLPYTSEHFNQLALHGQYESLTAAEVIELMAAYPDIYLVTDTKDQTQNEVMLAFSQLVHCAKSTHPEVLERIIPQIYNENMLTWISSIYPFRSVIFTLYATTWTPESVLDFCMDSGVRFITLPASVVTSEIIALWDTLDIRVAAHTVNDKDEISRLFDMGVDMIYTDFATPH